MTKIEKFVKTIDEKVDSTISAKFKRQFFKYFPVISATVLILLMLIFTFKVLHDKSNFTSNIISRDLSLIKNAIIKVDSDCKIIDIKENKVIIDFLNVKSFSGSVIGGINLANSEKWQGPYIKNNPTIFQKFYEIASTKEGIFIVPGRGTKLPNGLTIGTDFKIDYNSSITEMIRVGGVLEHKGISMATKLPFEFAKNKPGILKTKETINKINNALEELNEAMPFSQENTPSKSDRKSYKSS
jgi:hypothetical protein